VCVERAHRFECEHEYTRVECEHDCVMVCVIVYVCVCVCVCVCACFSCSKRVTTASSFCFLARSSAVIPLITPPYCLLCLLQCVFERLIKDGAVTKSGRSSYRGLDIHVGAALQQERHSGRLTMDTGNHQGRHTVLQREGGVVKKTSTETL
jgi:hypothetical protein